jgi:hypothetical protein
MKNLFILCVAAISFVACQNQNAGSGLTEDQKKKALKDSADYTTIQWLDSTFKDFGEVKEGKVVKVTYRFKNTGNKNLIITHVSASCGCTTPDQPLEPIAPGKEGLIKAEFKSEGHTGENRKDVYVQANTLPRNSMTLTFRVKVTN